MQLYRAAWSRYLLPTITFQELTGHSAPQSIVDPLPDDICMPPFTAEPHDDFSALMGIIGAWKATSVLELGTAYGNTVANICKLYPQVHVFTVNAPADIQSGKLTTYDLTAEQIGRVYRRHGYSQRVTQIYANTLDLDLSQWFAMPIIDVAIVDACHDTDYVINDFLKVKPYVRVGGVVLLHDTHPSMDSHLLGSYRACVRLRQRGFDIRHLADTWWGVWVAS
jgi:hypothetical protein